MNLFDDPLPDDKDDYPGDFACSGYVSIARELGAEKLGGSVYEIPPHATLVPYHYEWGDEEWLLVLAGHPTLRTPDGRVTLRPGDLRVFLAGPDGAHQCINETDAPCRLLMVSTLNQPRVIHYVDSDKIGVRTPGRRYSANFHVETGVDYWDREPGLDASA